MKAEIFKPRQELSADIDAITALIAQTQRPDGEIPWFEGGKTDPWDHVEAAMGLSIGGYFHEARIAFEWMQKMQLTDGSWYAAYMKGLPEDKTRDTNMSSYIAVGLFHYFLITGDIDFLNKMWPTVHAAMEFTLSLQGPGGEIYWARNPEGVVDHMALLTGSSSVYMSLKCALAIAKKLGFRMPKWKAALQKLENALRNRPHLFNMTKSRFSMDWFYPILSGAVTGDQARQRIDKHWKKFVVKDQGVLCVSDEPWVTLAETSELVLALWAMGNTTLAEIVFNWITDKKFNDGSCWCGFTVPDMTLWPEDKMTWTNAVVLMAADAIYHLTPADRLFNHSSWSTAGYNPPAL